MRKQVLAAFVSFVVALALVVSGACGKSNSSPVAPTPPNPNQLRVLTTQLPPAEFGQLYSARLEAAGGQPPYQWTADSLPAGLFVEPSGSVDGFLSSYGQLSFSVRVTDQAGQNASAVVTVFSPYESLPARHSLGDALEKLWVELVSVNPLRGSSIILGPLSGPPDCSRGACFSAVINLGFEGFGNPNIMAQVNGYFVGESGQRQQIFGLAIPTRKVHTWNNGGAYMIFLGFAPRELLLEGSYEGSCWPPPPTGQISNCRYPSSPPGEGATTFLLDYHK